MRSYQIALRVFAMVIVGIALVHMIFGVSSELFLGAGLSDSSATDPNLDSQNRFYGAAFMLYAAVWWLASQDLRKYQTLLTWSLCIFWVAGLSRLLSIFWVGLPTVQILALTMLEVLGPPIMYVCLLRVVAATTRQ